MANTKAYTESFHAKLASAMQKENLAFPCWVLLFAFLIRVAVWAATQSYLTPDSSDYLALAQRLLTQTAFVTSKGEAEIFRVPGFPFALPFLSFGTLSPAVVCLFQILLDTAVCYFVWKLSREVFHLGDAKLAVIFQAFSLVSIVYACRLLSETLFTFIFTAALLTLSATLRNARPNYRMPLGTGILFALSAYVRAAAFPFILLPLLLLTAKRRFRDAAFLLVAFVAITSPWILRNTVIADYPHFSSVGAINLYTYNASMVTAERRDSTYDEELERARLDLATESTQAEKGRKATREAVAIITNHPFTYAFVHLQTIPTNLLPAIGELFHGLGIEIGDSGTLEVIRTKGILAGVQHYFAGKWLYFFLALPAVVLLGAIYFGALTGGVEAIRTKQITLFHVFLLLTVLYFLVIPGGAAHPRFRVPAMPLLCAWAAYGWTRIYYGLRILFNT